MAILAKVKQKFQTSKAFRKATAIGSAVSVGAMTCLSCFAAEGDTTTAQETIAEAFKTAINDMLVNTVGYAAAVIPPALTIFGTYFAVRWGLKYFKGVTGGK